jgi:hypothetical protein
MLMLRFLLAHLAVAGLLMSPLTAAAAQVSCDQSQAMAEMAMPSMPAMDPSSAASKAQPCCDPGQTSKTKTLKCGQACAAMCCVAFALPHVVASFQPFATAMRTTHTLLVVSAPFEPIPLKRPPRSTV